jgi:hypothetical protein
MARLLPQTVWQANDIACTRLIFTRSRASDALDGEIAARSIRDLDGHTLLIAQARA